MTSDEIKQKPATDLSQTAWMREIALQLALLNEKPIERPRFAVEHATKQHKKAN
jgi:hypothetical protein